MICAAAGGNIPLIDYFLQKGASSYNSALGAAGQYSNLNTVKYLITKGADDYGRLFEDSSLGGNLEVMKFALDELKKGDFEINAKLGGIALHRATQNGHLDTIKFLIENGLRIVPSDIQYAESEGKYDIAEYLKQFIEN